MPSRDAVLSDPNLINLVYLNIANLNPDVAATMLLNWTGVSRAVRNACKADYDKVWKKLLDDAFGKYLAWKGGRLALKIAKDGLHPRHYVAELCAITRGRGFELPLPPPWKKKKIVTPRMLHTTRMTPLWKRERDAARDLAYAQGKRYETESLFTWVTRTWRDMDDEDREIYQIIHDVENHRYKQAQAAWEKAAGSVAQAEWAAVAKAAAP